MGEISHFFTDKTIFMTGGTGFLGKVLLERILWQLPQIRRIFLLTRPHCTENVEVAAAIRAKRAIFSSPIFSRLRGRYGERFEALVCEKVKIVAGDLSCPDLALVPGQVRELRSEVDVIINVAASVSFHERLDRAVKLNTLGPLHLLEFAKRFRNPTLLHVSTAYVSGRRTGFVSEQVLDPDISPFDLMGVGHGEPFRAECEIEKALRLGRSIESESRASAARNEFRHAALSQLPLGRPCDGDTLDWTAERKRQQWVRDVLSKEGLGRARKFGWFDTYTFTKAMGEQLLAKYSDGVPVIILRPSIVESSVNQPEPGWIESYRMSSPILFGYGKGEVPDFPGNRNSVIDLIPVDFVVSALLASLTSASVGMTPKVFHVGSSSENPLRFCELIEYSREYFQHLPLHYDSCPLPPWKYRSQDEFDAWMDRRRKVLRIALTLCHQLHFCQQGRRFRQKFAVRQAHLKRLESYARLYADYARLICRFQTDNTRQLFHSLSSQEQQEFFFDPTTINWQTYIKEIQLPGVRRNVIGNKGEQCGQS
jgi:fatty acyl-CoA reductase